MNEEIKHKLVRALRSGEYPQTRARLRTGNGFCCLGVACDLYRKETARGRWAGNSFEIERESKRLALPTAVVEWLGVPDHMVRIPATIDEIAELVGRPISGHDVCQTTLAQLNDLGFTFDEIATVIETYL